VTPTEREVVLVGVDVGLSKDSVIDLVGEKKYEGRSGNLAGESELKRSLVGNGKGLGGRRVSAAAARRF
jgi:hypothetical protein